MIDPIYFPDKQLARLVVQSRSEKASMASSAFFIASATEQANSPPLAFRWPPQTDANNIAFRIFTQRDTQAHTFDL